MSARMRWHGQQVSKQVHEAAAQALFDAAGFVLQEANKTVPHKEGTLARSGDFDVDKAKMQAHVFYDTPYAKRLHEHPEYNFRGGRRGKWLELTLKEQAKRVRDFMVERISAAFRR